jgi:hypothetical protein
MLSTVIPMASGGKRYGAQGAFGNEMKSSLLE